MLALGLLDGLPAITGRGLTRGAVAAVLQPARLLREGNALMNIGFALSSVGGAALAGLLIAQFGVAMALLVDAASFLAIAILLALTRGLPAVHVQRRAVGVSGSGQACGSRGATPRYACSSSGRRSRW